MKNKALLIAAILAIVASLYGQGSSSLSNLDGIKAKLNKEGASVDPTDKTTILANFTPSSSEHKALEQLLDTEIPSSNFTDEIEQIRTSFACSGYSFTIKEKFKICEFNEKNCKATFVATNTKDDRKRQFKNALYVSAVEFAKEIKEQQQLRNTKKRSDKEVGSEKKSSSLFSQPTILITIAVFSLLSFLLSLLGFIRHNRERKKINEKIDSIPKTLNEVADRQEKLDLNIKSTNEKTDVLDKSLSNTRIQISSIEQRIGNLQITSVPSEQVESQHTTNQKFFSVVPSHGVFREKKLEEKMNPNKHAYIVYIISADTAEYTLNENPKLLEQSFNIPNSYITPCFELRGGGTLTVRNYYIEKRGKLRKNGQNWEITEKGIISIK